MKFAFKPAGTALALAVAMTIASAAGGLAQAASKTIVETAAGSNDHTTLVAAVKAAGLVDTLAGKGPFTLFAPTNDAFGKLPAGTVDTLLKPENKAQLTKVLTCHVVATEAMAAAVGKMINDGGGTAKVQTVGGCTITAKMSGDKVQLVDEKGQIATVTAADLKQSNGVIHVIDTVLLPG